MHGGIAPRKARWGKGGNEKANYLSIEICILSNAASLAALSATSSSLYLRAHQARAAEGRDGCIRLVAKGDDAGVRASGGNLQVRGIELL